MTPNVKGPTLNGNHNKSNVFLIFLLVILLLGAIGLGLYTVMTQQLSTKSRADEVATGSATIEDTTGPTQVPEVTEPLAEPSTEPVVEPSTEPVTEASTLEETVTPTETQIVAEGGALEPTVVPTQALVSALSCPANGASCAWDAVSGATSYNVQVVDKTTNDVVTDQTISSTSVSFTSIIEHTYECSVFALNECGTGGTGTGVNTCGANVTPTPPSQPSATPTPGPSATPTPGPSATPTTPAGTVIVQNAASGPEPTIPSAGSSSTVYFMIIATILVATLFLVF